ncbi:MAG: hypothetical protein HOV80_00780 [Polyangiaceae bacterium]|nr:hypothetical protein [Polyangiaceae bacterium]
MTNLSSYRVARTSGLFATLGALATAACSGAGAGAGQGTGPAAERHDATVLGSAKPLPPDLEKRSCARRSEGGAKPDAKSAASRQSSSIVLVAAGDEKRAYVADPEQGSIFVIDAKKGDAKSALDAGGRPRQLLALEDGRLLVTIEDRARLLVFEPTADGSLEAICARSVPAAPWGLAVSPEGEDVIVTSGWDATVTVLAANDLGVRGIISVPRAPRGVIIDDDRRAFVTHLVGGRISRIDLDTFERGPKTLDTHVRVATPRANELELEVLRTATQGYALTSVQVGGATGGEATPSLSGMSPPKLGEKRDTTPRVATRAPAPPETRILVPMVSVDPGDAPSRRGHYYYSPNTGIPKETSFVATIDTRAQRALSERVVAMWPNPQAGECLLPRAITRGADGSTVFVACFGIDAVLELDALSADASRAELRRFDVPEGPSGVVVDPASSTLLVHSELARSVVAYSLGDESIRFALPLPGSLTDSSFARGRSLFYATDDTRISNDGVACASCHPDGLDDGLTWFTPEGSRQTPMLAGRLHGTAPYGWSRAQTTLPLYVQDTINRIGGMGLTDHDMKDLVTFLETMPSPTVSGRDGEDVRRGRDLFHSAEVGCATCHAGAAGVDAKSHDFALAAAEAREPVDTPSLRFIRGTAPYFHDGRYSTLEDLLSDPKSKMGASAKLSPSDRSSLAAYLRTL